MHHMDPYTYTDFVCSEESYYHFTYIDDEKVSILLSGAVIRLSGAEVNPSAVEVFDRLLIFQKI